MKQLHASLLALIVASFATAPAAAQYLIYEAPPVYAYPPAYEGLHVGPPTTYYAPPVAAPRRGTVEVVSPGDVEEELRRNGFTRLSPIEVIGQSYELTAVDPAGNAVALTVSMLTGRIDAVRVIGRGAPAAVAPLPGRRAAAAVSPPAPSAPPPAAKPVRPPPPGLSAEAGSEPPSGERDPLVVY